MLLRNLVFIITLYVPFTAAAADGLTDGAPISSWRTASAADKKQLIETITSRMEASAGVNGISIPVDSIADCVDRSKVPDELTIKDRTMQVPSGLAVMVCVKTFVPDLRKAKYQMPPLSS
ncbi:hypothetical protein [Rhodanobacter sp. L36]|uniref:hypothetical protein n=1 Tax=Rhodanobacter sp. L36 TaxID=1747221 RepID=UPI00131E5124|nr:hypothetical protein [Rhodanobacter sp. L36]